MDFVENYICGFVEEIQLVYFDKNVVMLYFVIYYIKEEMGNDVKYKLLVVVFDELLYILLIVFVIMKQVIVEVRVILLNVEMVYYMMDLLIL